MRLSRIAAVAALITVANLGTTGMTNAAGHHALATAAVPPVGPKTVVMTTCSLPTISTDARVPASVVTAIGPAGGVYGFASCRTTTPSAIYFFLSRAGHSTHELTPYRGSLETIASDGTGAMYLCYSVRTARDTWLYLARRSAQGAYSPPTLISHAPGTARPQVSLAAAPGTWWLVWSEAIDAEQFAPRVIYERRTMLGVRQRHQITFANRAPYLSDWTPALAVEGQLARLAWVRAGLDGTGGPGPQITRLLPDGTWQTGFRLPGGASPTYQPRMVISQGRTYLVFAGSVLLDNGTGHFTRQPIETEGRRSAALSDGVLTIAMLETNLGWQPYLQIDELRSGSWSSAQRTTFDSFDVVVSWNGHASLVMHKQTTPMLYLVTEQ